jgi:hypothetical protein
MDQAKNMTDVKPNEPIYEFDVVTFRGTDKRRGSKKGEIATVVDIFADDKNKFGILTESGDVNTFNRQEFRLATPKDIENYKPLIDIEKHRAPTAAQKPAPSEIPDDINTRI